MKPFPSRSQRARRGGQTLVETALVLATILLPMLLGIVQFGMIFNASNTMTQIAREGGRYAAVNCKKSNFDDLTVVGSGANAGQPTPPVAGTPASLRRYLWTVSQSTGIPWDSIKNRITVDPPTLASRIPGQWVTVTVTYPMANKVFLGSMSTVLPLINKLRDDYVARSTFVIEFE